MRWRKPHYYDPYGVYRKAAAAIVVVLIVLKAVTIVLD
ncbi:MAG: hypothetical protein QOD46_637 [Actinomycetota bacterium]|nr:hypothetical protein [Actinomycetota bacterium]